jgi:hypothetical protein
MLSWAHNSYRTSLKFFGGGAASDFSSALATALTAAATDLKHQLHGQEDARAVHRLLLVHGLVAEVLRPTSDDLAQQAVRLLQDKDHGHVLVLQEGKLALPP